ncbi:MAG: 4Fe-4S dicluster domain-containing protein [Nitrospinota bacterium]|nr:MAG: 4Fe-4S dicluster domain-containing protein [Nitrospinota bacterium]
MGNKISRRYFLKVLGLGSATATVTACSTSPPVEKLIPYLIPAEEVIPGKSLWYATTCRECPAGCGLWVRTREGRAVKVEGNPLHPVNAGRLCARGQASLQGLYNPDRIRQPLRRDQSGNFQPLSWEEAEQLLATRLTEFRKQGKASGIVFLTPLITGSLARLLDDWLGALGAPPHLAYEPFAYEPLRTANRLCFGQETIPMYDIAAADFLLSFGAEFLETWLSPVAYARALATLHGYREGQRGTFIHIAPRLSLTAANADTWIPIQAGSELFLALGMIHAILSEELNPTLPPAERKALWALVKPYDPKTVAARTGVPEKQILWLARRFVQVEASLALGVGTAASGRNATLAEVAVNLLNYVAGNIGKTVRFGPTSTLDRLATYQEIRRVVTSMQQGDVPALLLAGVNPLFTLPEKAGFRSALEKVPLVVSFSSYMDETTAEADLILPDHTPLERWGDYSPWSGVTGLLQPAMQPVFQTKALGDVVLSVAKQLETPIAQAFPWPNFYTYLRERWQEYQQQAAPAEEFDAFWMETLRQGGRWESRAASPVSLPKEVFQLSFTEAPLDTPEGQTFALYLYPSLYHYDGRGANRPWLQEVPDPLTQIVWDNWLEIHPETARRLGISEGDLVEVASPHGRLELPAHLYAWIRPDVVAVPLGQGHTRFGRYAEGRGTNPIHLLSPEPESLSGGFPWLAVRVTLAKTGKHYPLVSVAGASQQFGREIAQVIPLSAVKGLEAGEKTGEKREEVPKQLYPPHAHPQHRWGMVIDLNACIGCSACVVACYAENNLAVVGKERVAQGREMSWIRIERYFEGERETPDTRFLPMLCQQCDAAPCEPVCPVYATYHTPEGLNAQIYNRCIGVRYCSNNCPYKVRRFNWFQYTWPEPLPWQLNPDVTVREVGIMEKCTFCIQRIREGKEQAKDEGRPVRDGEIVPACAQTCPTQAIVFGDLKDPESRVARLAQDPRRYRVLEQLNTQPAITYLKKIIHQPEQT